VKRAEVSAAVSLPLYAELYEEARKPPELQIPLSAFRRGTTVELGEDVELVQGKAKVRGRVVRLLAVVQPDLDTYDVDMGDQKALMPW
jgi:hypothetical protein